MLITWRRLQPVDVVAARLLNRCASGTCTLLRAFPHVCHGITW